MLNSVWTAALSVALGSSPMAHPGQQAPQPAQPRATAPVTHRAAPPRILHHVAAPIPQQQYQVAPHPVAPQHYQYQGVTPAQYYSHMPLVPQWQYAYPSLPQHQVFAPHPGYGVIPVGAEVPAPTPPAEAKEEGTEERLKVAVPNKEPALNEYLQEISSYVGPGFRTYSYQQVSASSDEAGEVIDGDSSSLSPEDELRLHLTKVGASAYAAELAKLRARHDYEQLKQRTAPATQLQVPPAPAPLAVDQRPVAPGQPNQIAPANYQPPSRIAQLKQQLEEQTARLQALQGAVKRQTTTPYPTQQQPQEMPKPVRRGLLYQIFDR